VTTGVGPVPRSVLSPVVSPLSAASLVLSRVSASRTPIGGTPAWALISLRLALPSWPSIAFARCSVTARWATLAAISGYWTDRF
jgi:hypothetical protein